MPVFFASELLLYKSYMNNGISQWGEYSISWSEIPTSGIFFEKKKQSGKEVVMMKALSEKYFLDLISNICYFDISFG